MKIPYLMCFLLFLLISINALASDLMCTDMSTWSASYDGKRIVNQGFEYTENEKASFFIIKNYDRKKPTLKTQAGSSKLIKLSPNSFQEKTNNPKSLVTYTFFPADKDGKIILIQNKAYSLVNIFAFSFFYACKKMEQ